jgi:hypothetical protein
MNNPKLLVGVYSHESMKAGIGTQIYLDTDNEYVEVSMTYPNKENAKKHFLWDDAEIVSENLVKWVCDGVPPSYLVNRK